EREPERAELSIGEAENATEIVVHRDDHHPVDVIEEVDAGEQREHVRGVRSRTDDHPRRLTEDQPYFFTAAMMSGCAFAKSAPATAGPAVTSASPISHHGSAIEASFAASFTSTK